MAFQITPIIKKPASARVVLDVIDNGIKIEDKTSPQNIKALCFILSAKKPNNGCNIDENKCPSAIITLIVARVIPNF